MDGIPVSNLPEKRGLLEIHEQPRVKVQKVDDPRPKQKIKKPLTPEYDFDHIIYDDGTLSFCPICDDNVKHTYDECPDRATGYGKFCDLCVGDCMKNWEGEHAKFKDLVEILKLCDICGYGKHWPNACPKFFGVREEEEKKEEWSDDDSYDGF